MPLQEDIESTQ